MSEVPNEKYLIYLGYWDENDEVTKIGKTTNMYNRCCNYNTSHPFLDFTPYVIIEVYNEYELNNAEVYLHYVYEKYSACHSLTKYNKRNEYNEWFTTRPSQAEVEKHLQKFGIDYKAYSDEEIEEEMCLIREKEREYNEKEEKERNKIRKRIKELENKRNGVVEYEWNERQYQTNIINYSIQQLATNGRLYIELATGAGKTYIMKHIMFHYMPEVIIFLSPRKKINKQNTSDKYLSTFKNKYEVFNISEQNEDFDVFMKRCKKNKKKIIIVGCPINKNIYSIIKDKNLQNVFIWFDEAHHTIENWTSSDDKTHNFLLFNETNIKYRVFTSASPDYNIVKQNHNIFGNLYCEITVKELIAQKWLCPILPPLILGENIQDYNLLRWITDGFIRNNRRFGFSFHSRDDNAFELFYKHYTSYKDGNNEIKPFLLIDDKSLKNREILRNISLDYKFRDDKVYECSPLSIAYVVKKYDMGYDFPKLDYICITDKKVSAKDIIQCIGRGTRSDKLGPNGTNRDKDLLIALPTYMDKDQKNEYKNIIEVMRYLIYDLEMDIETMFTNTSKPSNGVNNTQSESEDYEGERENTSKMLELLYNADILNRPSNLNTVIKLCMRHNIAIEQDYHRLRDNNPAMRLRTTLYDYGGFFWQSVVDPNKIQYYGTKRECIEAQKKIMVEKRQELSEDAYDEFMEDVEESPWKELNKYDSKIPPYPDIDKYYSPN